jgi:glycosyltransferase involved in cell wall biosynthesis
MKKISIGVPVYNEEKNIKKALNNIINQEYRNKEIIISDNFSSDDTRKICLIYKKKYNFIRYYRQKKAIDPRKNYNFVLNKAKGDYFIWQAADDLRSKNFLKENVNFLNNNLLYSASTGITVLDKAIFKKKYKITFELNGNVYSRICNFFFNKWVSRGIFDSLVRTKILKKFIFNNFRCYLGWDWVLIFYLILKGKINRNRNSIAYFGAKGRSFRDDSLRIQRYDKPGEDWVETIFPFKYLTMHILSLINNYPNIFLRIITYFFLIILNFISGPIMIIKHNVNKIKLF